MKNKQRKYKIHYDRIFARIVLLALIIFMIFWLINKCVSGESVAHQRPVIVEASEAGRADAAKVLETTEGSMERVELLLYIRSRENELREKGYGHAADDYIESARRFLSDHNIK